MLGPDDFYPILLKETKSKIFSPLTALFNVPAE